MYFSHMKRAEIKKKTEVYNGPDYIQPNPLRKIRRMQIGANQRTRK